MASPLQFGRGAVAGTGGVHFNAWSSCAERIWVCLFDERGERETQRVEMARAEHGVFHAFVDGIAAGARYGLRTDGRYDPENGFWHDPDKLLMDPYALEIDRPYRLDPRLCARRGEGGDTAGLMPKARVPGRIAPLAKTPPLFRNGGLIYEASVRGLTMLHPDIPPEIRGTVSALGHPAIVEHLKSLGVDAIELMPVTAWIDDLHLPALGLSNVWGYNPVSLMALDPRLAPGGVMELRRTVKTLREAGIGVILDLVFNHTGESDVNGPTLCFRGLDNLAYYRHLPGDPVVLANDTGCGNTIATQHPEVHRMILDTLRHFVTNCGVDGFRFDLAPVLGRDHRGFDPAALFFREIEQDPVLSDRVLIAEPWDIGPGGYHLGNFPSHFLEWNDRFRDDIRRFWRGDEGTLPALATRLAGSSDIFGRNGHRFTRSVNFIAAHDGMTLADITAYEHKHNEANGEENRDGHDENLSWNNGVEGETGDGKVLAARERDLRALLATLLMSRGTIMLTAGDEFGRTQKGNNNAYAQDNGNTWVDWKNCNRDLAAYAAALARFRNTSVLHETGFLAGEPVEGGLYPDVEWLDSLGNPMDEAAWNDPRNRRLTMLLSAGEGERVAVLVNGDRRQTVFTLPAGNWRTIAASPGQELRPEEGTVAVVPGRSVMVLAGT